MTSPPPLNRRFSEAAFRKYEPFLQLWEQTAPDPCALSICESPQTTASRLRDAVRGYREFWYPSTLNRDSFLALWSKTQVTISSTNTVILKMRQPTSTHLPPPTTHRNELHITFDQFESHTSALLQLLNDAIIERLTLTTTPSQYDAINHRLTSYNIVATYDPSTSTLHLT